MAQVPYLKQHTATPSFSQHGLAGFGFNLDCPQLELNFVRSEKGHDYFVVAKEITHVYYILSGEGEFEVNGQSFAVHPGEVVEIPPSLEFTYSGKMTLLLLLTPPFSPEAVRETRPNPKVLG